MNNTSDPISIAIDSINNVKTGGGFIPDFGSGLSQQPPTTQWLVILLIVCLIYHCISN